MPDKKDLILNTALADLRHVTEETISAYRQVKINAATVLTTPRVQELCARYGCAIDAAVLLSLPEDAPFAQHNGSFTLTPGTPFAPGTALQVNGVLIIQPGCEETVQNAAALLVNGKILCPASMAALVQSKARVNGSVMPYPDEAILLPGSVTLDKVFLLRVKPGATYFVSGKIKATLSGLPLHELSDKKVQLIARQAIVLEEYLSDLLPLLPEDTDLTVVPDGWAYQDGNLTLTAEKSAALGGRVFVNGDLIVHDPQALKACTALEVTGTAYMPQALTSAFYAVCTHYGDVVPFTGYLLREEPTFSLTESFLLEHPEGIALCETGMLTIQPDVSPDLLKERVTLLRGCGCISASDRQKAVLLPVSQDIGAWVEPDMVSDEENPHAVVMNAASYQL